MAVRQGTLEGLVMLPQASFWQGKRVLLTGHTGFKGGWLALWLRRMGAEVWGMALQPDTRPNLFEAGQLAPGMRSVIGDIRDAQGVAQLLRDCNPEVVFHLAAQPLVRASYRDPLTTFATNVMGTAHVLDAMRGAPRLRVAVMVTTDKVYRNLEQGQAFAEDHVLGGHDPYSASKAASETVIASYRDAFLAQQGVAVASARAGNVVGGGDWSEDRLVPDAVRAWQGGQELVIRSPASVRPWQHVLEPLCGYLRLAEVLWQEPALAGAYNFGPAAQEVATVRQVVDLCCAAYGAGAVRYEQDSSAAHEAATLVLDTAKAERLLGVRPRWTLQQTLQRTMSWYRAQHRGDSALALCHSDIEAYEALA